MADQNLMWKLARRPPGGLPVAEDFLWEEADAPSPEVGQILTRTLYLSLDPYQWGRRRSGLEAVGEICHGRTVAQVVESRVDEYQPGDYLFNTNGWQTYGLTGEGIDVFTYMFPRKLDPGLAPISTALGVLGMLGLTAYGGLYLQCRPRPGETVVISAASGGVGQVAGQIAAIQGCRVVGVAGKREKGDFVREELGFDACVSHLSPSFNEDLLAACPDGIDIYFESVGGRVFKAVLPLLNQGSRITLCGLISQYGNTDGKDPRDTWKKTGQATFEKQSVEVHDLWVRNFVEDHQARFLSEMAEWIRDGRIRYREDLCRGLGEAPRAFRAMLEGGNFGKTLVAVGEDPTSDTTLDRKRAGTNVLA